MPINVQPVPTLDDRINDLRARTAAIVNEDILPFEDELFASRRVAAGGESLEQARAAARARRTAVQDKVKAAGLWAPHLPRDYGGMGLDFLAHAYMNEVLAYAVGAAGLFGVEAPNSGNAKILVKYGTEEQKRRWLLPLVEGTMQSGFSMTEPHNPGSDPSTLDTAAVRDGDDWIVNGHKWFTSNGRNADFFVVMCRAQDPAAPPAPTAGPPAAGRSRSSSRPTRRASTSCGASGSGGGRPRTTARSCTGTCGCPWPTRSAAWARATRRPRSASAPGGSSTA